MIKHVVTLCIPMLLAACASPNMVREEPNTVTCILQKAATGYESTCTVPCLVNALAIDIDRANPNVRCSDPPCSRKTTLQATQPSAKTLIGTMQGKAPEDTTRYEVVNGSAGKSGIAKTPYGWFQLRNAQQRGDTLTLTIAANKQLPPTSDDVRIVQRAVALIPNETVGYKAGNRMCRPNPQIWSLFLCSHAGDDRHLPWCALSAASAEEGK